MGRRTQLVSLIVLLGCIGGCATQEVAPTDQELTIALKNVKPEWLAKCAGLGERPGSHIGDLEQDFNDAATLGALCKERHNDFIDYIGPLIHKVQQPAP